MQSLIDSDCEDRVRWECGKVGKVVGSSSISDMVTKLMIRGAVRMCADMAKVGNAGVVGKDGVGEGSVHVVLFASVVPLDEVYNM